MAYIHHRKSLGLGIGILFGLLSSAAFAAVLINGENASLNGKGDLRDNNRTILTSRDGMVDSTGAVWDRPLYDSNYARIVNGSHYR